MRVGEKALKRLVYVSGTRADFGLFRSTLEKLSAAGNKIALCLTGTHLDDCYGRSESEVEESGLPVVARIVVPCDGSKSAVGEALSIQVNRFCGVFEAERPDAVILLGDRSEMLMAAVAALHVNVPIIHIHGGELSGTIDESMRHAISKISHYHFVSTDRSRERLIRMGEHPDHVFTIGAPGLDDIGKFQNESRDAWADYGFAGNCFGLVVFHPVVQDAGIIGQQFQEVIAAALELLDGFVVFRPNSDHGRSEISEVIDSIENDCRIRVVSHLGRDQYLRLLSTADLMIGNSSSGIIEAASFSVPVVNIGDRQNLRERSENIFEAPAKQKEIVKAGHLGLGWRDSLRGNCPNVYGDGKAGERFVQALKNLSLGKSLLKKQFYE